MSGSSLVELLVSIFVVSIGLVGVGALIIRLFAAQDSVQMDQRASLLMSEFSQRIFLLNDIAVTFGTPTNQVVTDIATAGGITTAPTPNCMTSTSSCNFAQLTNKTIYEWKASSAPTVLQQPATEVTISNSTVLPAEQDSPTLSVLLKWPDINLASLNASAANYNACPSDTAAGWRCVTVVVLP